MPKFYPPVKLQRIATGRNVVVLIALFLAFGGVIMPALEDDIKALSGGVGVIDLQFYYAPATVLKMLSSYGPEGSRLYIIAQWTVDLIFPFTTGLMVACLFIWLGRPQWWWLGVQVAIADWTENIFITVLLARHPDFSTAVAWGSCFFTGLKWSTMFFAVLLLVFSGSKKLLAQRRARMEQSNSI